MYQYDFNQSSDSALYIKKKKGIIIIIIKF